MPALTPEQEALKQAALAADQDGQHIYTSWRDSNNSDANDAWHKAASPAAILALFAQLEAKEAPSEPPKPASCYWPDCSCSMASMVKGCGTRHAPSVPAHTGAAQTDADKLQAIRSEYDEYMADVFAQMCGMPFAEWVACNRLTPKYIPPPKLEWEDDVTERAKRIECAICGGTRTAFGKVCDCRGEAAEQGKPGDPPQ